MAVWLFIEDGGHNIIVQPTLLMYVFAK